MQRNHQKETANISSTHKQETRKNDENVPRFNNKRIKKNVKNELSKFNDINLRKKMKNKRK